MGCYGDARAGKSDQKEDWDHYSLPVKQGFKFLSAVCSLGLCLSTEQLPLSCIARHCPRITTPARTAPSALPLRCGSLCRMFSSSRPS